MNRTDSFQDIASEVGLGYSEPTLASGAGSSKW